MRTLLAAEIAEAVGGELIAGPCGAEIRGVSIDSRTVSEGDLFVALKGKKSDGHLYLGSACEKGASAVLVSEPVSGLPAGTAVIKAVDTLRALQDLAGWYAGGIPMRRIAVTGRASCARHNSFMTSNSEPVILPAS